MKTCRHCGNPKVCRPRGLCWVCYYTPEIFDKYPVTESKFNNRGVGNGTEHRQLPTPTQTIPGSLQKLAILCLRAKLGQQLFHPADRSFPLAKQRDGHARPSTFGQAKKRSHRIDKK